MSSLNSKPSATIQSPKRVTLPRKAVCRIRWMTFGGWCFRRIPEWSSWRRRKWREERYSARSSDTWNLLLTSGWPCQEWNKRVRLKLTEPLGKRVLKNLMMACLGVALFRFLLLGVHRTCRICGYMFVCFFKFICLLFIEMCTPTPPCPGTPIVCILGCLKLSYSSRSLWFFFFPISHSFLLRFIVDGFVCRAFKLIFSSSVHNRSAPLSVSFFQTQSCSSPQVSLESV